MSSAHTTIITEQNIIDTLRPEHEFAVATGNRDKANTIVGIVHDLAHRIAETNEWDADERMAFIRRVLK